MGGKRRGRTRWTRAFGALPFEQLKAFLIETSPHVGLNGHVDFFWTSSGSPPPPNACFSTRVFILDYFCALYTTTHAANGEEKDLGAHGQRIVHQRTPASSSVRSSCMLLGIVSTFKFAARPSAEYAQSRALVHLPLDILNFNLLARRFRFQIARGTRPYGYRNDGRLNGDARRCRRR